MAGIVDFALGAGVGGLGALVANARHDQQQDDAKAADQRVMDRESALMYLRNKYAQDQAQFADGLERGRMDKQAELQRGNAKYSNDLQLDAQNDPRTIEAKNRERQSAMDDYKSKGDIDLERWDKQNGITHAQALELLAKQQAGQRRLMNMRLAAKGAGGGGDDDGEDIGSPDFVKARKDLTGYLGIDLNDKVNGGMQMARQKFGLANNSTDKDVDEVLKAATLVYAANPALDPNEAAKMGRELALKKINLTPVPVAGGKTINSFFFNGKRYAYGRPN